MISGITTLNRRTGGHSTLKARIGRRLIDCLPDTGKETTVLPASIVDLQYIRSTSHVLTAENGTPITSLGEASPRMKMASLTTSIVRLGTEHVTEVMIGIDWVSANRVTWDFGKSRIRIVVQYFRLKSKPNYAVVRKVYLQDIITVPARSEVDLPTKVPYYSLTREVLFGLA